MFIPAHEMRYNQLQIGGLPFLRSNTKRFLKVLQKVQFVALSQFFFLIKHNTL